ncbi:MAG: ATP-binding protein [Gammaproteobacteria bacterium]|nr:ATP-binding protein [Gammaproteobacteria bacterium]
MPQYLKMIVSGDTDAGKTHFGLTAPRPCIVDMEGNAALFKGRSYKKGPEESAIDVPFDFSILTTRSFADTMAAVNFLLDNPKDRAKAGDTLVIDNLSLLWEALQEAYQVRIERKIASGASNRTDAEELQFSDWRLLKKPWKELMRKLFNLPMHVILLARIDDEYVVEGGTPRLTGRKKLDAEKKTKFFGTLHLHLDVDEEGVRTGAIIRDKWGIFQHGQQLDAPNFWTFESLLSRAPSEEDKAPELEDDEEVAERDSESFDDKQSQEVAKKALVSNISKAGKVLFSSYAERGREAYNELVISAQGDNKANSLSEMTVKALTTLLDELRQLHLKLKRDSAPPQPPPTGDLEL